METLPKDPILEFNPTTLRDVRKEYNLDKPGRMDEAIDILEDWVKKQPHFEKKDFFSVDTNNIIVSVKSNLYRDSLQESSQAHLPKMTKDHYRVYFHRVIFSDVDSSLIFTYYKYQVFVAEYIRKREYATGLIIVMDFSDINIMDFITKLNVIELRQALTILREGYGLREKALHFITPFKMVDVLVSICKQVLSEKIANRIHIHKTVETLYQYVEKEILPEEYGGMERSLEELNDAWFNIITSNEHMDYLKMMNQAKTNESYRQKDQFNEDYVGMPGSFRSLSID